MVKVVEQSAFDEAPFDEGGMNLHRREGVASSTLIVLIHGLGGRGYQTWGGLPKYLFDTAEPASDIALYDHRSGLRLLKGKRGDYEHWLAQFVEHFRELSGYYENIFLIGHSQGGRIAEDAARAYLQDCGPEGNSGGHSCGKVKLQPLSALILLASPRAGSALVPGPVQHLVPTLGPLRLFGNRSAITEEFYSSHVERQNTAHSNRKHILPTYAAIAGGDRFVSAFSAAHGIPGTQRKHFSVTHTRIVKPSDSESEIVRWINRVIQDVNSVRTQRLRDLQHAQKAPKGSTVDKSRDNLVVTELQSDSSGSDYAALFLEQCTAASHTGVEVINAHEIGAQKVDLLIAAHDAERFLAGHDAVRDSVGRAHARRVSDTAHWVNIYPVGDNSDEARLIIEDWLAGREHPQMLFIKSLATVDDLREQLARTLNIAVTRKIAARRSKVAITDNGSYLPLGE